MTIISVCIMLPLLPFRILRIRICNYLGGFAGFVLLRLFGCPITISGRERLKTKSPVILISNHTSTLDLFLAAWLAPVGTVGMAKKEIVYFPFIGQIYYLSGHFRVDRSNHEQSIIDLQKTREIMLRHNLSLFTWPEGTRSKCGQLLPFKKGIVHLAVQTRFPVVPFVVHGSYKSWGKNTLTMRRKPIHVEVLPMIDTSEWEISTLEKHLKELHDLFLANLPNEQHPRRP
ncbi:MAG: 1-acyl-sn-glycerol-3-phosphate acyltransferase [Deltaproteobacteria bacterium]|nr:1-acyl-sn-glycerol-3-phosphate acyltransferase [Deltaproteobacteria bacterium]